MFIEGSIKPLLGHDQIDALAEGACTCRGTHGVGMNRPARSNNEVISKIMEKSWEISLLYSAPGDRPGSRLTIKGMTQADDHLHVFLMGNIKFRIGGGDGQHVSTG